MKKVFLSLALILCATQVQASNTPITSEEFKKVLVYGTFQELNNLSPKVEKTLLLRLYMLPVPGGTCFHETEVVCQKQYLLSVSTFDEQPEVNVFKLKVVGEISQIEWLQISQADYAELVLQVNQYTQEALANNANLKNKVSKVILKVRPKKLVEAQSSLFSNAINRNPHPAVATFSPRKLREKGFLI